MLTEKDKKYILHPFTTYKAEEYNIPVVKGRGAVVWDEEGNEYIDAVGSWWVNLHGHAHPYINRKITEQLNELEHIMFSGFTHRPATDLAERILKLLGDEYVQLFYSDNGSTAVEVAIKMAVQYWKNQGEARTSFIAFRHSYHGDTFGAMSVSERDIFIRPFLNLLFDVHYIDLPAEDNIESVQAQLTTLIREHRPVAFIFEPLLQGAAGMRMYDAALLDQLLQVCRNEQVLTIADEVFTGFYRTGQLFAIHGLKHQPDFVCLSKGITGGYLPLGATVYTEKIAEVFRDESADKTFYHGHSYTANPIACAAANASLDLLEKEGVHEVIEQIRKKHEAFVPLLRQFPQVRSPRVMGPVLAFDVDSGSKEYFYLQPVRKLLYDFFIQNGIIMRPLGNVVYLVPPYCITEEELDRVYHVIQKALEYLQQEITG